MNKNLLIKVMGILLVVACCNWFIDSQKLHSANDQIKTVQAAQNKATSKMEDLTATNEDLATKNNDLKNAQTHLTDGQRIKNNKFTIDYEDDGDGDYTLTIYPNKKNEKLIAQQGDGAQGLEIVNVPKTDKRTTSAN